MEHFDEAAYLRFRGLPFSASPSDVVQFVDGCVSEGSVVMGLNHEGRPSGEAWVQFPNLFTADMVLQSKNKQLLGTRYIEIFPSNWDDVQLAKSGGWAGKMMGQQQSQQQQQAGFENFMGSTYLRMRGLPFAAGAEQVAEFFKAYNVEPSNVVMGFEAVTGRPSGEAWVQFPNEAVAKGAMQAMNKKMMGTRYIELFMSSFEEAQGAASRPTQEKGKGKGMKGMKGMQAMMMQGMMQGMADWSMWGVNGEAGWGTWPPVPTSSGGGARFDPY